MLNSLRSKLEGDPAADLALALKHQVNAYPQLRDALEQAAQKKAAAQCREEVPERNTANASSNSPLRDFFLEGPVEVTHALDERIKGLVGLADYRPGVAPQDPALAAGINKAIENGEVLWKLHGTVVLGLGAAVIVKIGTSLDPDEVANLLYINARIPAVPAPSCLGCLITKQRTYVFMSRSDGVTLESLWPDLSVEHKASVKQQLGSIFRALREGPQSADLNQGGIPGFGGFASAICKDTRREQRVSTVPIRTEAQFNDFLCHPPGRSRTAWIALIRSAMRDDHRLVMTHGDLHPRNIMVKWEGAKDEEDGDGHRGESRIRVTALIDWELSGWYPEHWEFVKALSTINARGKFSDWLEYLPTEAIGTWPVELSIDSLLDRWLG